MIEGVKVDTLQVGTRIFISFFSLIWPKDIVNIDCRCQWLALIFLFPRRMLLNV